MTPGVSSDEPRLQDVRLVEELKQLDVGQRAPVVGARAQPAASGARGEDQPGVLGLRENVPVQRELHAPGGLVVDLPFGAALILDDARALFGHDAVVHALGRRGTRSHSNLPYCWTCIR